MEDQLLPQGTEGIGVVAFFVDEEPRVFVKDAGANQRFLESLDWQYWVYQAELHGAQLSVDSTEHRQRAAAALRIAYGQGLETLFAMLVATVQVPTFPLGWLASYRNNQLRSTVRKINSRRDFPTALRTAPSWTAVAQAVFAHLPEPGRDETVAAFAKFWTRCANVFLQEQFEPEYNSLKHGMRASVGGFTVTLGPARAPQQAEESSPGKPWIASTEFGSTFWLQPQRVSPHKFTYELGKNVSSAWVPQRFITALPLIGMSIKNAASSALIAAGGDPTKVEYVMPSDLQDVEAPWKHRAPSITTLSMGYETTLPGWEEPTAEELRAHYESLKRNPTEGAEQGDANDPSA